MVTWWIQALIPSQTPAECPPRQVHFVLGDGGANGTQSCSQGAGDLRWGEKSCDQVCQLVQLDSGLCLGVGLAAARCGAPEQRSS